MKRVINPDDSQTSLLISGTGSDSEPEDHEFQQLQHKATFISEHSSDYFCWCDSAGNKAQYERKFRAPVLGFALHSLVSLT
jgi:hypothetical protein